MIEAYRVGFTGALTSILLIAAGIAFLGSIAAFALIRSRDFVGSAGARHRRRGAAHARRRRLMAIEQMLAEQRRWNEQRARVGSTGAFFVYGEVSPPAPS